MASSLNSYYLHVQRPSTCRCGLCELPYTFIGRTETLTEDFDYVAAATDTERFFADSRGPDWMTSQLNSSPTRKSRAEELFSLLTPERRIALYDIYRFDFEIFGYSVAKYM